MTEDKKIVTWSMTILFLSLAIVYSLMYMRNSEFFTQDHVQNQQKSEEIPSSTTTTQSGILVVDMSQTSDSSLSGVTSGYTQDPTPGNASGTDIMSEDPLASTTSPPLLSGTSQFFGVLDILDILGQEPEYILQDSKGNYFAYFGKKGLDFVRTIQMLGGNVYTMATESEILENQLFGDKVSFINLLVFKDKLVFLVVEIDGETWLIQVEANKYHESKSYLKSLFIY